MIRPVILPFKKEHIPLIQVRLLDEKVRKATEISVGNFRVFENDYSRTISHPDGVVGSGGIAPVWKGVAVSFVLTSDLVVRYRFLFHKTVLDCIRRAIKDLNLHRIESPILVEHKTSQKWAERMGFKCEGILRSYDSDRNDYFMYSWVRGK